MDLYLKMLFLLSPTFYIFKKKEGVGQSDLHLDLALVIVSTYFFSF